MSEDNFLENLRSDPNLFGILVGSIIWIAGLYILPVISIIGVVINSIGFTITCFATAASALKRPINQAWIGLLIGSILYILGPLVPIVNNFIFVAGAVMILFFAIPMALQTGKVPMMENLQEFLDENIKRKQEKESTDQVETTDTTETSTDEESPQNE
jgi:hypothetical protein